MAEAYLKEVQLPSRGLYYDGKIPDGLVTIEPLGTKEEKMFSSPKANAAIIDRIFNACVKLPFPHEQLLLGDRLFLLLQIRSISYGDEYKYSFRCANCGSKSWGNVNLDEIDTRIAPDNAAKNFDVELPIKKDTVTLRLLTGEDENKIRRYSRQLNAKTEGQDNEAEYIYRFARRIEAINGVEVGIREAMEFVETIKGKDSLFIRDAIQDRDIGPNLLVEPECSSCGFENGPFPLPLASEFFRPRRRSSATDAYLRAAEVVERSS